MNVTNPFEEINNKLEEINSKLEQLVELQNEPVMLTFREASDFLKLSAGTLYMRVHNKKIPYHKRGNRLWFDRTELVAWLKGEGDE